MGGMHVLEFAYFGADYVRTIVAIATSAQSSAWNISWGEAQRQSIFADRKYNDGYYHLDDPPACGLGAARMSALLTYRSRDSFECRFGRRKRDRQQVHECDDLSRRRRTMISGEEQHFLAHNEGHISVRGPRPNDDPPPAPHTHPSGDAKVLEHAERRLATIYSAQSYLRYQSEKFIKRFDANCYIAITHKLDTHDVARDRASNMQAALAMIQQPALIIGIKSDGLFTYREQCELADMIPNGHLKTVHSPEGHDGFLLEHDQINLFLTEFIQRELSHIRSTQAAVQFKESRSKAYHTTGSMLSTWGMGARAKCTSK
ncbi:hypothetical protein DOTSEDRAFT_74810 [Dothistroma septosporum NZE10]|uniref:AB hydrolase-1 domain-containing protein n=1 Tax=Dothistroma septosporum (strain NZE10 / CBS 128990) TaxID=675120 RepID=N1PD96_DOTSN|nr:hypothetical protein DOTSEDRAFT_74810 [Dothistroma septosporum NZE10]